MPLELFQSEEREEVKEPWTWLWCSNNSQISVAQHNQDLFLTHTACPMRVCWSSASCHPHAGTQAEGGLLRFSRQVKNTALGLPWWHTG